MALRPHALEPAPEETARFVAFRSHRGFESVFCTPGEAGAHEKGGVEGEAGFFRRNHWLPVPRAPDLAEAGVAALDGLGRVRVRTNAYSAPLPPGTRVQVKVLPATVELWHGGACGARHARSYGRHQEVLDLDDLEHYLDVLVRKPGALAGSAGGCASPPPRS